MSIKHFLALIVFAITCTAYPAQTKWIKEHSDYRLVAETTAANGIAEVGKEFTINITISPLADQAGFYQATFYVNGIKQGQTQLHKLGESTQIKYTAKAPGSVSIIGRVLDENKKAVFKKSGKKIPLALGFGVMVSPEKLSPGLSTPPEDLDLFWQKKRAELDKVPVAAKYLNTEKNKTFPGVVCKDVRVDCIGKPVSGYLCMPENAKPKSLPAVVTFDGAGVRSASRNWAFGRKAISFSINSHGVDNGHAPEYYKELYKKEPLKSYRIGTWHDHNSNYFAGMYLRCMRALDFVKSLPEWDGKTLIVRGGSQGGAQSLASAALDPQVTLCSASVPSMCDLGARLANRLPGGPLPSLSVEKQQDPELAKEAAYVDNVWLAKRIKAAVYVSAGTVDHTCNAVSIQVFFNALPDNITKDLTINFTGDHGDSKSAKGAAAVSKALETASK